MKLSIILASLLVLSASAFAGGSDTGSADEDCAKMIMKKYFAQSAAIIEAFYKADTEAKWAPTAELRREAAIKALDLSREMAPQIKSLRIQQAINEASTCE